MQFWEFCRNIFKRYIYLYDEVDTLSAAERIKSAIWFKGPNVWILAFSIIIASVGLNVNSTAVIIGAMLISPLMGPIIGVGFSLGTNDTDLLKASIKNLLVMVIISLFASTLFFILSPLSLVNPTELEARTSPTIYDVLIALFGGLAGILESSRKERGTVLAGVAIATALMPPLCTAGYGLAHLNMRFFTGALYLFVINSVFIALATYLMVKYLRFRTVSGINAATAKKRSRIISTVLLIVLVPSIWSAAVMIRNNNFERNARLFVQENRLAGPRSYIYDYDIHGRNVSLEITGDPLSDSLRNVLFTSAAEYKIKPENITLNEHSLGLTGTEMTEILRDVYSRTDAQQAENQALLISMQARIDALAAQVEILSGHHADSLKTE
ncbi:MAG: DUF389 domain-containing protein [Bacteroidales bacterium]|nr:DUF389 domain-containing protein [Bacteroidales bacterium]